MHGYGAKLYGSGDYQVGHFDNDKFHGYGKDSMHAVKSAVSPMCPSVLVHIRCTCTGCTWFVYPASVTKELEEEMYA